MSERRTPTWLVEVLGETHVPAQTTVFLLFGVLVAALFGANMNAAVAPWRVAVALLLVGDIAAGALANFTRGTNDYYAARASRRLAFIAIHVHVVVLAWVLDAPLAPSVCVWLYAVGTALVVDAATGRRSQRFFGAAAFAFGLTAVWLLGVPPPLLWVYVLFLLKVTFAFAVDHEFGRRPIADGLGPLLADDRDAFVELVAEAFADDPLFVLIAGERTNERSSGRRRALAAALFDMNLALDRAPYGIRRGGRLVAVMLLEPPAVSQVRASVLLLIAVGRFLSFAPKLGIRAMQTLNRYFKLTRQAAPQQPQHYLTLLAVAPSAQGHGLGQTLVEHAVTLARESGRSRGVALDTENAQLIQRYERWGFRLRSTIAIESITAHIMDRPIEAQPTPSSS